MATKESGWYCRHSASISSETNSTASIIVKCYWQNNGWTYQIGWLNAWTYCNGNKVQVASNGSIDTTSSTSASAKLGEYTYTINKTTSAQSIPCKAKIESTGTYVSGSKYSTEANITVGALPSYTVSYNANGGSGAPSSQTKWYGTNLTLSASKPSRTGYTFAGWNTNSSGTGTNYAAGATYTGNATLTLYAKWTPHTYTVSYNANGGSGAPGNQTKTYGVNLTLSSTKPTRTNYNFKGWSTSANGGVVYNSGATYTNNSSVTLYAVWELAYTKPRITNFNAYRCTSDGTASESGTYVKASFNWSTDYALVSMYIDWTIGIDWPNRVSEKVIASGTSGSVSQIVGSGNISAETTYSVRGWVNDGHGSTYSEVITMGTVKYPIDVKAGGTGVAIGKVAEKEAFEVGMETYFNNDTHLEKSTQNDVFYYAKRADTGTQVAFGVGSSGVNHGVWSTNLNKWLIYSDGTYTYLGNDTGTYKVGIACSRNVKTYTAGNNHTNYNTDQDYLPDMLFLSYWNGAYNANGSSNLTYCSTGTIQGKPTVLYDNSSGTTGTVTLSQSAVNFGYLEIFCYRDGLTFSSGRIANPNGKSVIITTSQFYSGDSGIYLYVKKVTISGTSITANYQKWSHLNGSVGDDNNNKIVKVVGWR